MHFQLSWKEPCLLRHRLRSPSRGFAPLSCSRVFPQFFNWANGENGDVEQLRARRPERCRKLFKGSQVSLGFEEQHGPRPPSKGPTHWLRSAACFWQAPFPGERCAWAPLLRKPRAPSVIDAGVRKAWKLWSRFPHRPRPSILGCPAKGSPIPKIRVLGSCRKSDVEKKKFFADRPAPF